MTVRRAGKADRMLAFIPLIFSLQQALEGFVWLTQAAGCGRDAGYGFAIIAFCLWPLYVPVASWRSETDRRLRAFMLSFALPGGVVAAAAAWALFVGLKIDFATNKIQYLPTTRYPLIFDYIYAACVIGPFLLHRNIYLRLFGCLILVFFGLSILLFNPARYSVWCFFAAISSIVLYFFVTSRNGRARGAAAPAPEEAHEIEPQKI
ncbi:MAG: hypothetical protein P4L80_16290 [Xanthobacteraceae bacterium]|nr:hypothetical protein [Xanthobacteraceae bacterium]